MNKFLLLNLFALAALTSYGGFAPSGKFFDDHRILPSGKRIKSSDALAIVDTARQRMYFSLNGKIRSYLISSARAGEGSQAGSGKTPLGWHKVKYRFGKAAAIG